MRQSDKQTVRLYDCKRLFRQNSRDIPSVAEAKCRELITPANQSLIARNAFPEQMAFNGSAVARDCPAYGFEVTCPVEGRRR